MSFHLEEKAPLKVPTLEMSNGMKLPVIGLGTAMVMEPSIIYEAVRAGYRLFDCASIGENEEVVGEGLNKAIRDGLVTREELFVVTKLSHEQKRHVERALHESLKRLNLEYVDLYLDHWPISGSSMTPVHRAWEQMEHVVDLKLTRSIGLSNYSGQMIQDLLTYARIRPIVNQLELHPFFQNRKYVDWMREQGLHVMAYRALANGHHPAINREPRMIGLAEKRGWTVYQIAIAWGMYREHIVLAKTGNFRRLRPNLEASLLQLDKTDLRLIEQLDSNDRLINTYPPIFYA